MPTALKPGLSLKEVSQMLGQPRHPNVLTKYREWMNLFDGMAVTKLSQVYLFDQLLAFTTIGRGKSYSLRVGSMKSAKQYEDGTTDLLRFLYRHGYDLPYAQPFLAMGLEDDCPLRNKREGVSVGESSGSRTLTYTLARSGGM